MSEKRRADALLVDLGLAPTRAKAQALILAGEVYAGDERVNKAGALLEADAALRVVQSQRFVSRGGTKLEGALTELGVDVRALCCVDVGAATGGFTDCLLQRGARKIYAVDVGYGQLARKLSTDERVVVMDRTNARYLAPGDFSEPVDLVVVDASFISVEKLLPAIARVLRPGGFLLAMVKPQFEAGKDEARRGRGVIKDPEVRKRAIAGARAAIADHGFELQGECDSALAGPKGNLEHFVLARKTAPAASKD